MILRINCGRQWRNQQTIVANDGLFPVINKTKDFYQRNLAFKTTKPNEHSQSTKEGFVKVGAQVKYVYLTVGKHRDRTKTNCLQAWLT